MKFYMLVLALDTTTRQGSAALTRDGALLGIFIGDATLTHGVRLPGDLLHLLQAHGVSSADVDLFAVAAGPGSFTGLRVGIATQQGFALANNRPLIGVSALDAVNAAASSLIARSSRMGSEADNREVAVWMDAQRGQVFSALYSGDRVVDGPAVDKPVEVLARWGRREPRFFAGDGALEYVTLIEQMFPESTVFTDLPPLAPCVARLAEEVLRKDGPAPPDSIRPIYIRRSDAELARERLKV